MLLHLSIEEIPLTNWNYSLIRLQPVKQHLTEAAVPPCGLCFQFTPRRRRRRQQQQQQSICRGDLEPRLNAAR